MIISDCLLSIAFIIFAYLLGSIASAIVVCKVMRLPDPRQLGSHNPGATNVLRIGGNKAAFFTLLGDTLKGIIPILLAKWYGLNEVTLTLVAFAAFLGHLFPIFFRFQGGKGVATFMGCLFALNVEVGFCWLVLWMIVAVLLRYSSLAALIASAFAPFYFYYFTANLPATLIICLMVILLIYRHQNNIVNLFSGKENKIGKG